MFNQDQLKLQAEIIKFLTSINYPTPSRISKEIIKYIQDTNTSWKEISRRLDKNEPWEYIQGYTVFKGLKFKVNNNTLIPRIETEDIIDIVKDVIEPDSTIIDVGTGSGAIITTLAKQLGNTYSYIATDISKEALEVAKENVKAHSVDVKLQNTNLLKNIPKSTKEIIIANLPYIPTRYYEQLDSSVKDYEPKLALDGGIDGLDLIKELLIQIEEQGRSVSHIVLEIDPLTLDDLKEYISKYNVKVVKDYRGQDRFVVLSSLSDYLLIN